MTVSNVAFGSNDSWVITDSGISTWSSGLPEPSYNLLNGRYNNRKQRNSAISIFAMGDGDDHFALYEDGAWDYSLSALSAKPLDSDLKQRIHCVTLGPKGSYIIIGDSHIIAQSLPFDVERTIESKKSSLRWASLGVNGSYFLMFGDGTFYWDVEDLSLDSQLKRSKKTIKRLYLSPTAPHYFILFEDGSCSWSASVSFANTMNMTTEMAPGKIAYLSTKIKQTFDCGRPILDTMYGLKHKKMDVYDIPCIAVVKYKDVYYSLDNRRLWAFKTSGVDSVPVIIKKVNAAFIKKLNLKLYCEIHVE